MSTIFPGQPAPRGEAPADPDAIPSALAWSVVVALAAFLCLAQGGVMLSLVAGHRGLTLVAPASLALAGLASLAAGRKLGLGGRSCLAALGLTLAAMAFALGFSAGYFDLSWDGQWYHQTAIYALAKDWNPLTDPLHRFPSDLKLFVRHYAKGPWYVAAAILAGTGHVEWGKCPAVLGWIAMGLAAYAAGLDARLGRVRAAGLAAVVALNPVVLSELTTFLVDGIMISFLTVAVAAACSALRMPRGPVIGAGILAAVVSINAKFTGLVFLCFACAAGTLWCVAHRRRLLRGYLGWTALALIVGAGVFGYNPYVTNTVFMGNPFYPVLGSSAYPSLTQQGREGIALYETPKNFLPHGRLYRLAHATFGRPGNAPYRHEPDAQWMWPLAARVSDLFYYRYHETRVAGFGPFFSAALLLGLGLGLGLMARPGVARGSLLLAASAVIASLLVSLHLWWARYGPQLWLLPIVPVVFAFGPGASRKMAGVAWALVALLCVNAAIVGATRLQWETRASAQLRRQLTELRQTGQTVEVDFQHFGVSGAERLQVWGIPFKAAGRNQLPQGTELMSVVEGYPGVVRYRLEPEAPAPTGR